MWWIIGLIPVWLAMQLPIGYIVGRSLKRAADRGLSPVPGQEIRTDGHPGVDRTLGN